MFAMGINIQDRFYMERRACFVYTSTTYDLISARRALNLGDTQERYARDTMKFQQKYSISSCITFDRFDIAFTQRAHSGI